MKFTQIDLLPYVAIALFVFIVAIYLYEKSFFAWVGKHWFLIRSKRSRFASLIFYLGFILLGIGLLDLRGPKDHIYSKIPDQKTIILLDSSSSMLVEDVLPSRFKRSVLLAQHFVKQAVGHQIAVILFSDTHKKLIPFTTDVDLILSRLHSLNELRLLKGGSNLRQAIMESIQHFMSAQPEREKLQGNLLIFTDSEETATGMKLDVPKGVSVGVVGIGTRSGGPIPLRSKQGVFLGHKKYKGEVIISKLNESLIGGMSKKIKEYRSWIANSVSLPTDEIVKFFEAKHFKRNKTKKVAIRPVLAEYLTIPGIILLALASLFKLQRTYMICFLFCFSLLGVREGAIAEDFVQQKIDPEKLRQEQFLMDKFSKSDLTKLEKSRLIELFVSSKRYVKAKLLFEEMQTGGPVTDMSSAKFNYATALLVSGEISKGVVIYSTILERLRNKNDSSYELALLASRKNTLLAIKNKKDKKGQKNKKDKQDKKNKKGDKDKKQKQKKGKNSKSEKPQPSKKSKDKSKGKSNGDDSKPNNQNKDNDENTKNKDKSSPSQSGKKQNPKERERQRNKQNKMKQLRARRKLAPVLKQLVDEDRGLQRKLLDTSTSEKRKSRERKDW